MQVTPVHHNLGVQVSPSAKKQEKPVARTLILAGAKGKALKGGERKKDKESKEQGDKKKIEVKKKGKGAAQPSREGSNGNTGKSRGSSAFCCDQGCDRNIGSYTMLYQGSYFEAGNTYEGSNCLLCVRLMVPRATETGGGAMGEYVVSASNRAHACKHYYKGCVRIYCGVCFAQESSHWIMAPRNKRKSAALMD